jgi:hypothetical protein
MTEEQNSDEDRFSCDLVLGGRESEKSVFDLLS